MSSYKVHGEGTSVLSYTLRHKLRCSIAMVLQLSAMESWGRHFKPYVWLESALFFCCYHNEFSEYPSPQRNRKKCFLVMRILRIYLTICIYNMQQCYIYHVVHYIPTTYLFYNWKSVHFEYLEPIPHLVTPQNAPSTLW